MLYDSAHDDDYHPFDIVVQQIEGYPLLYTSVESIHYAAGKVSNTSTSSTCNL